MVFFGSGLSFDHRQYPLTAGCKDGPGRFQGRPVNRDGQQW
jgi:hypothetical protein